MTLLASFHRGRANIRQDAADTLALVKSTCQKYDDHHLSSTTKDLQAVINKARIFSLCTASADITREDILLCDAGDQYLTGIIVFDGHLSVAASADTGSADRSAFLQSILVGNQVRDIIAHPQKVYADQTDIAGRSYDYAIAARQDGPGAIVCYTDITPFFSDKYSLSLSSILDIDRQRDTVIVVTDGKHVISSNAAGLEVLPMEDCPITNAVTSDRLPDDRTLIELKNDGTIWHEMLDAITNRIIVPKDRAAFRAFCDAATAPERLRSQRFLGDVFEAMNGSWYQVLLIPQSRSRTDEVTAVMPLSRNVTAQKQKEIDYQQRLRETAEQASLANTAKTDFLRRMSHDIRTPINGIRGMTKVAEENVTDPARVQDRLSNILSTSDFLLELVNNVLDMSKLEAGEVETEHEPGISGPCVRHLRSGTQDLAHDLFRQRPQPRYREEDRRTARRQHLVRQPRGRGHDLHRHTSADGRHIVPAARARAGSGRAPRRHPYPHGRGQGPQPRDRDLYARRARRARHRRRGWSEGRRLLHRRRAGQL